MRKRFSNKFFNLLTIAVDNRSIVKADGVYLAKSHLIAEIEVQRNDHNTFCISKFSFVDLTVPVSEKMAISEATVLNKSLSALLHCVAKLGKSSKDKYIPFRDNLLTKVMKEHLINNSNTVCLGVVSTERELEECIKTLDSLSRFSKLKIKRSKSVFNEAKMTPRQLKDMINDLQDEKKKLAKKVDKHKPDDCQCENKLRMERKEIEIGNREINEFLQEKLNIIKSKNEAHYVNELNLIDLSDRKKAFLEQTLSQSGNFVMKGGNVEQFLAEQDRKFREECSQLEEVIQQNYETQ